MRPGLSRERELLSQRVVLVDVHEGLMERVVRKDPRMHDEAARARRRQPEAEADALLRGHCFGTGPLRHQQPAVRLDVEPRREQRSERDPLCLEERGIQQLFLRCEMQVMSRIVNVHHDRSVDAIGAQQEVDVRERRRVRCGISRAGDRHQDADHGSPQLSLHVSPDGIRPVSRHVHVAVTTVQRRDRRFAVQRTSRGRHHGRIGSSLQLSCCSGMGEVSEYESSHAVRSCACVARANAQTDHALRACGHRGSQRRPYARGGSGDHERHHPSRRRRRVPARRELVRLGRHQPGGAGRTDVGAPERRVSERREAPIRPSSPPIRSTEASTATRSSTT